MSLFNKEFTNALELSLLGIYRSIIREKDESYRPLLKKSVDKFAYLNEKYNLYTEEGIEILPSHSSKLIEMLSMPLEVTLNQLPLQYMEEVKKDYIYYLEEMLMLGADNTFYLLEEAFEMLKSRHLHNAKNSKDIEYEYNSQLLFNDMILRNQEEYNQIRSFLIDRNNTLINADIFTQTLEQAQFIKKYYSIFEKSYHELPLGTNTIYLCPSCNLVLKENHKKEKYCVSENCKKRRAGFINVEPTKISGKVFVLNGVAARCIYFPGQLENKIKKIVDRLENKYKIWPDKDTWDFRLYFPDNSNWVIDAKVVKNPYWIKKDIELKEKEEIEAEKIIYVVPNDYLISDIRNINKSISNSEKFICIKLNVLEELIKLKNQEMKSNA